MTPGELNLTAYRAATFSQQFTITADDGTAVDLSGYTATMAISIRTGSETAILTLTSGDGVITLTAEGVVTVTIAAAAMEIDARDYVYDLQLEHDGIVDVYLAGKFTVKPRAVHGA